MSNDVNQDPDVIERDIRQTQDEIGATVQKLEEQLTPKQIARSVIGGDRTDWIDDALQIAKQNPIPVALIAVGAIWLLAKSGREVSEWRAQLRGTRPASVATTAEFVTPVARPVEATGSF